MSGEGQRNGEGGSKQELPLDVVERIDEICDRFEAAWRAGERPGIEDYLHQIDEPYRTALAAELLASEVEARRRLGESTPSADAPSALLFGVLGYQTGL